MFEPLFKIFALGKMAIGIIILLRAIELFNNGYVSEGLIDGIDMFTTESPELITFMFMLMIGLKLMR